MALLGYVSNERHEALADVRVDVARDGEFLTSVRSTASGAMYADVEPGPYRLTLRKEGYGPKRTTVSFDEDGPPDRIRLLPTDRLLGYAWPKWARPGESVEYRIHSNEDVRVSLWRYGYDKEQVQFVGWERQEAGEGPWAGVQHVPDGDFTQTGVGWSGLGPEHVPSPHVEAPDESGLYYFHLETPSGEFFSFPLVVAPAEPTAAIAVLASTNTWNAYNGFGGRSNYVNADSLPDRPISDAREDLDQNRDDRWRHENHRYQPLSFDRPSPDNHVAEGTEVTDPIRGSSASHVAPAEWRLLGWLEREGYEYDLYAEYHLHDHAVDLDDYDALVIHTHPEYWSYRMFSRVDEWVQGGGDLLYLGGNGINCEVNVIDEDRIRILNAGFDSDDRMRDDTEPIPANWSEDTFESRFHKTAEAEGGLLGVTTSRFGLMTAAPYEVTDDSHWVFDGTGLERGDRFGEESLQERVPGGASGHETDKLSRFAPSGIRTLAKGINPEGGGAHMVHYDVDDSGSVFSVGSITFPLSLLVDDDTSTITGNVLDRSLS